jgi:ABC-type sugar transport system ATPase subunit
MRRRRTGDASRRPRDAIRAAWRSVPEDRQRFGLHFNLSIRHNIALRERRARAGPRPRGGAARAETGAALAIKTPSIARRPGHA